MSDTEPVHKFVADMSYLDDSDDVPRPDFFPHENDADGHTVLAPPSSLLRMSSAASNSVVLDPIMEATRKEEAGSLDSGSSRRQRAMRSNPFLSDAGTVTPTAADNTNVHTLVVAQRSMNRVGTSLGNLDDALQDDCVPAKSLTMQAGALDCGGSKMLSENIRGSICLKEKSLRSVVLKPKRDVSMEVPGEADASELRVKGSHCMCIDASMKASCYCTII